MVITEGGWVLMALVSYGANDRKSKSSTDTASALATPLVHHFDVHYLEGFFLRFYIFNWESDREKGKEKMDLLSASSLHKWLYPLKIINCIHVSYMNGRVLRHMSRNPDQNRNRQYLTRNPTSEVGARRGSLTHCIRPCLIFWLPTSAPLAWWLNLCYPSGNLKMPGIQLQRQLT